MLVIQYRDKAHGDRSRLHAPSYGSKEETMKIYQKLFAYVPKEKYNGFIAIFFSLLSAALTMFGYYFMFRFLDALMVRENLHAAKVFAVYTAAFLTVGALLYMLSGLFSHLLGFRLETNLRKRGIDGLSRASFRFFDLNPSGMVRRTIDDNAVQTHQVVAHMIPDNAQAFLTPLLAIILGFLVSFRVGAVILFVLFPINAILFKSMTGTGDFMRIYQEALATLSAETVEYVRGMQVVKIFGTKLASFKALYKAIVDYAKYAYGYSKSCKTPYVLFQWLFFGLMAILALPLAFFWGGLGDPKMLALELIMLLFLSGVFFVSFMRIMWASMYIYKATHAVDTLEKLYGDMQMDALSFGEETSFLNYDIAFEHVSFSYGENKVLEDLSFTLKQGSSYALVGSSGSGKTTIAKLISGFYKVDEGAVKIGGKAIEAYSQEALIQAVSFVFQDAKLFKKSIYDNVALAKKGASREEVLHALHLACCDPILDKFPDRENTLIGSRGVYLSGGEKQRIAIARAILKNAPIVVMDEASAAIDPDNEHELQRAFQNLIQGKTIIMIAHRLSSIRAVDEVIVLEGGKIIERGTDAALMQGDTKYKALVSLYNSANEWRVGNEKLV